MSVAGGAGLTKIKFLRGFGIYPGKPWAGEWAPISCLRGLERQQIEPPFPDRRRQRKIYAEVLVVFIMTIVIRVL